MSKTKKIDRELLAATCALLGSTVVQPAAAQEEQRWEFDTALLFYSESDDRVRDTSLTVLAKRDYFDERFLTLNIAIDSLTGASASGATALDRPQTFTSPSGDAVYATPAGETPLDDTFLDTRLALSASWSQPLGRLNRGSAGVSFSREYDYLHSGVNFSFSRDFNKRNTTVSAGLALARDSWSPVGGAPVPLAQMLEVGNQSNKRGDDDKNIVDVLFGITQVINRNLIVQLNYSFSDASGYLNDPYKILSVVDPVTGDTNLVDLPEGRYDDDDDNDEYDDDDDDRDGGSGRPDGFYRFEGRPESRARHGIFGRMKYHLGGDVMDLSYRYATDDWRIVSHTLDGRYRWPFGGNRYLEPHYRYYSQSAAEFYRFSLASGEPLPSFASSDFRLGEFDAHTVGLEFGTARNSDSQWSVRVEYYRQTGIVPDGQIIGRQADREQFADLDAIIAQFSYRFKW